MTIPFLIYYHQTIKSVSRKEKNMISTLDFKTKTEFINRKNASFGDAWGIALDIGYSAVKGFSPNRVYRFPSYARKLEGRPLGMGNTPESNILYRENETSDIWAVGEAALDCITSNDAKDSNETLYGRNRYFDPMFLVVARTGLAMGMMSNTYGSPDDKKLVVQTGLPPAYIKTDAPVLRGVLSGIHTFELKIGNKPWKKFTFVLTDSDIHVMEQPMGTLISIATNQDGSAVPEAEKYFKKRLLILDPGFRTFDAFNIAGNQVRDTQTFDNLGMWAVLQRTADEIYKSYSTELRVPAMQKNLADGTFTKFDRRTHSTEEIAFADILEEQSKNVCTEALERIYNIYNDLIDHDYLVITGGTGEAWNGYIREALQYMSNLTIIPGNLNDDLSCTYSNVRGYYMFLQKRLRKLAAA